MSPATTPPGPPGRRLVGNLTAFRRNPLALLRSAREEYGDSIYLRMGGRYGAYAFFHPDQVKHVLQENHAAFRKVGWLKTLLGDGLLTSEGDAWLRQRRVMQPAFHRQQIAMLAPIMTTATERMLGRWNSNAGSMIDISREMTRLTLTIVAQALFGVDVGEESDAFRTAIGVLFEPTNYRLRHFLRIPRFVPWPGDRRLRRAHAVLDHAVQRVIEQHRQRRSADTADLLSMLLAVRDADTGAAFSDQFLRDQVMTLLFAGHETTASALSWIWYLLGQQHAVNERVRAELATVLGGRLPTVADIPRLTYTTMVIQEALRLYPPAWGITRQTRRPTGIGGYLIPVGGTVVVSPYVTHRHPAFWCHPDDFDPDHFLPEAVQDRPRFAFFPFGAGPRMCIGSGFAMLELQLVVATIAQAYRVTVPDGMVATPLPRVTLRPRAEVPVVIERYPC